MAAQDFLKETKAAAPTASSAVVLVSICAGIYVVSQFLRNSIGVIAPDLAREVAISASQIGLLSSLFFLVFGAAQVPLGIAIDRFGPRACILGSVSLAVAGSLLFAMVATFPALLVARILMGLGCAALLVAPVTLYARWFRPEQFATLLGIHMAVGNLGTLIATAPLARATEAIGWRLPFVVIAGVVAVGAVLVALFVRDDPPGHAAAPLQDSLAESVRGVAEVIRTPSAVRLLIMHACSYAMYATILGLWGGPYLAHVHGYDLSQRGDMLLLLAGSQICGAFLWGLSDRWFGSYRVPTLIGALSTAGLLFVLALGLPTGSWLVVWFGLFGLCAAFTPTLMAHGKSLFPGRLTGRGITLMNFGTMGGVFVWQAVTGAVMDLFPTVDRVYPSAAYGAVFAMLGGVMLVAVVIYARARDPWQSGAS